MALPSRLVLVSAVLLISPYAFVGVAAQACCHHCTERLLLLQCLGPLLWLALQLLLPLLILLLMLLLLLPLLLLIMLSTLLLQQGNLLLTSLANGAASSRGCYLCLPHAHPLWVCRGCPITS